MTEIDEIISEIYDEMKGDCVELALSTFKGAKDKDLNNGQVMEFVIESLDNLAIDIIKGKRNDNLGHLGKSAFQKIFSLHCLTRLVWGEVPESQDKCINCGTEIDEPGACDDCMGTS